MNARATLPNGKTVKENVHRIVAVRSLQGNFEVVWNFVKNMKYRMAA
jgi:flagellar basal body rod protein FlgC